MPKSEDGHLHDSTVHVAQEALSSTLHQTWEIFSHKNEAQWFWKGPKGTAGGRVYSQASLQRLIHSAEAAQQDLYLNINATRRCGTKASRDDVLLWRYIVLDMDPVAEARPTQADAEKLLELFPRLGVELDNEGVTILDSGRGLQVWLAVAPRVVGDDAKIIERGTSGLLHLLAELIDTKVGWRLDTSCSDLARVVRCPGSINQKTGARAHYLTVGRCSINGFGERVLRLRPKGGEVAHLPTTPVQSTNIASILPYLTHTARRFILHGTDTPGRHSAAYATARNLHEIGVSAETAYMHMEKGAAQCYVKWWNEVTERMCIAPNPLPRADIIRIIERTWDS